MARGGDGWSRVGRESRPPLSAANAAWAPQHTFDIPPTHTPTCRRHVPPSRSSAWTARKRLILRHFLSCCPLAPALPWGRAYRMASVPLIPAGAAAWDRSIQPRTQRRENGRRSECPEESGHQSDRPPLGDQRPVGQGRQAPGPATLCGSLSSLYSLYSLYPLSTLLDGPVPGVLDGPVPALLDAALPAVPPAAVLRALSSAVRGHQSLHRLAVLDRPRAAVRSLPELHSVHPVRSVRAVGSRTVRSMCPMHYAVRPVRPVRHAAVRLLHTVRAMRSVRSVRVAEPSR